MNNTRRPSDLELDPIDIGVGFAQPLPGGRVVWAFDEQPEGRAADQLARLRSTLERLGHHTIVGTVVDLQRAAAELIASPA